MSDDKKIVEYFIVAGIGSKATLLDKEDFTDENFYQKEESEKLEPITDIAIIIPSLGESCPDGYTQITHTPGNCTADLNHGSIKSPDMYLCYRRGRDRPPLTEIGVMYQGKERLMPGCQIVQHTVGGRNANVNNTTAKIYMTYNRADETASADTLVVTDICIILENRGETPPHTYMIIPKCLNKAIIGSDVYICYKKSMRNAIRMTFTPELLFRYPKTDNRHCLLPPKVEQFCLPLGATIELWPINAQVPKPKFSTFVLTEESGRKSYGAAISFYEQIGESDLEPEIFDALKKLNVHTKVRRQTTVHASKSICVISRWPFFDSFRQFLDYLYTITHSSKQENRLPIEKFIKHFFTKITFPTNLTSRILAQFPGRIVSISRPIDSPLPQSGASFTTLLSILGPDNCLLILTLALCEKHMIVHSLRTPILTATAEAITNICFPLNWSCAYVPLLPVQAAQTLQSPVPLVVGLDSKIFDMYEVNKDNYVLIDLDTCQILNPHHKEFNVKLLPKRPTKVLKATLERLLKRLQAFKDERRLWRRKQKGKNCCTDEDDEDYYLDEFLCAGDINDLDLQMRSQREQVALEMAVREAFVRFMACCLKGYSSYLKPVTTHEDRNTILSELFDKDGFLKSKTGDASKRLFKELYQTQAFNLFIQIRSFVSDQDACLTFFDQCIEKVDENRDEPPLFEETDSSCRENTTFIAEPDCNNENIGNGDAPYIYSRFPNILDDRLLYDDYNEENNLSQGTLILKSKDLIKLSEKLIISVPPSPMTLRSKPEIRSAQKLSEKASTGIETWVKHLLSYCYSLWFVYLPSYVKTAHSKEKALRRAFDQLVRIQNAKLLIVDEVCYRILMQLCAEYDFPKMAHSLLMEMKKNQIQPNAVTYGYYNKAAMGSRNKLAGKRTPFKRWLLVKNVFLAYYQFKYNVYLLSLRGADSDDSSSLEDQMDVPVDVAIQPAKLFMPTDRASIGGTSDRGYCSSISNDDCNRLSHLTSSQDSLYRSRKPPQTNTTPVFRRLFYNSASSTNNGIKKVPVQNNDSVMNVLNTKRVTKVIRPDCLNDMKSHILQNKLGEKHESQAGLLMTSTSDSLRKYSEKVVPRKSYRRSIDFGESDKTLSLDRPSLLPFDSYDENKQVSNIQEESPLEKSSIEIKANAAKEIKKPIASPNHIPTTPVTSYDPLGHFSKSQNQVNIPEKKFVVTRKQSFPLPFENWDETIQDSRYLSNSQPTLDAKAINRRSNSDSSSADMNTPKSRKSVNRTESFQKSIFGSAKKYASTVAKKIGDFTTPPPLHKPETVGQKGITGSTGSLACNSPDNSSENISQDRLSLDDINGAKNVLAWSETAMEIIGWSKNYVTTVLSKSQSQDQLADLSGNQSYSLNPQNPVPFDGEAIPFSRHIHGSSHNLSQIGFNGNDSQLELEITSCWRCEHCQGILYDEEIASGWAANDNNFNTTCQFCKKDVVTRLSIFYKGTDKNYKNTSVIYLNPLVLRRQMETIIESDGDFAFTRKDFAECHPDVFWNLVWYFQRLKLPSDLPKLLLQSNSKKKVIIHTIWDNVRLHKDEVGTPMYILHKQADSTSPTIQALLTDSPAFSATMRNNVIYSLNRNDFLGAIRLTLTERQKLFNVNQAALTRHRHRSIYRNLLFLAISVLGNKNIDRDAFDREYFNAFQLLNNAEKRQMRPFDYPPTSKTIWTRKMFETLDLPMPEDLFESSP